MDIQKHQKQLRKAYKYGATSDQVADINNLLQGGTCELCKKTDINNLVIEHNHKTGKFRGVTCQSCNMKIAHVEKHKNYDTCNLDLLDWITYRGY